MDEIGYALSVAQFGEKHPSAKSLKGLGSGVLEIIENHQGDTYRAAYTVRFKDRIYVLHCFQKKSKKGAKTPQHVMDLIKDRLKHAEADYAQRQRKRRARK
jgi:phage-related protein